MLKGIDEMEVTMSKKWKKNQNNLIKYADCGIHKSYFRVLLLFTNEFAATVSIANTLFYIYYIRII